MRGKRSEGDKKSAQGLPTHRLLGVLRLQRHIQELHHGTDGRIKAETFETFRHLLEHDVELLLDLRCGHLASLGRPVQEPVPDPPQKTVYAFNTVIVPLWFLFRWADKQLVQTH